MPNFPAAKMSDSVVGLDFHTVLSPVAVPIPFMPHPYLGSLMLWYTPQFPTYSSGQVLINGVAACGVGAMGYSVHPPLGLPAPPTFTNLLSYWRHHLLQVPKVLGLAMLTILANIAIAGFAQFLPKDSAAAGFMKDVTGMDTTSRQTKWDPIKNSFSSYTKWQTWVQLLLPPLPYPGSQASTSVGSPNVTVNGAPLAFAICPLVAASCTDSPFQLVPNAMVLGFSNVRVGVSFAALLRAIAVQAAKNVVHAAVKVGAEGAAKSAGTTPCSS
jgi:hypothetical protein